MSYITDFTDKLAALVAKKGQSYWEEFAAFYASLAAYVDGVRGMAAAAGVATSTTSMAIGTGTRALAVQDSKFFGAGQPVRVAVTADIAKYMDGTVTSYDKDSGALTVEVGVAVGAGTFAAWTITIGGARIAGSVAPLPVAEGGTGSTTVAGARTNLGAVASASGTLSGVTTLAAGHGFTGPFKSKSGTIDLNFSEDAYLGATGRFWAGVIAITGADTPVSLPVNPGNGAWLICVSYAGSEGPAGVWALTDVAAGSVTGTVNPLAVTATVSSPTTLSIVADGNGYSVQKNSAAYDGSYGVSLLFAGRSL